MTRREKEEGSAGAVGDTKLAQRLDHRLDTVTVGGHDLFHGIGQLVY